MSLSKAMLKRYADQLASFSNAAVRKVRPTFKKLLAAANAGQISTDYAAELMIRSLYGICLKYGDACGVLSADMFEYIAQQELGSPLAAELADPLDIEDAERVVQQLFYGKLGNELAYLQRETDKMVRNAGRQTMTRSIDKHAKTGVHWARVPTGPTTCAFCLMLASRGFVYASEISAGGDNYRYHADCDCQIVPSWESDPTVEGYDPDMYYDLYMTARKETPHVENRPPSTRGILSHMRDIGGSLMSDAHVDTKESDS